MQLASNSSRLAKRRHNLCASQANHSVTIATQTPPICSLACRQYAWAARQKWHGASYAFGGSADAVIAFYAPVFDLAAHAGTMLVWGSSDLHATLYWEGSCTYRESCLLVSTPRRASSISMQAQS